MTGFTVSVLWLPVWRSVLPHVEAGHVGGLWLRAGPVRVHIEKLR